MSTCQVEESELLDGVSFIEAVTVIKSVTPGSVEAKKIAKTRFAEVWLDSVPPGAGGSDQDSSGGGGSGGSGGIGGGGLKRGKVHRDMVHETISWPDFVVLVRYVGFRLYCNTIVRCLSGRVRGHAQ